MMIVAERRGEILEELERIESQANTYGGAMSAELRERHKSLREEFNDLANQAGVLQRAGASRNWNMGLAGPSTPPHGWSMYDQFENPRRKPARLETNIFSSDELAHDFGQWCLATMSKQLRGYDFKESIDYITENYGPMALTANNDGNGTTYTIPTEFSSDIINLKESYGVARRIFRNWRMTSDQLLIPRRTSGLTAYYPAEGNAITESTNQFDQVQLHARVLASITRLTGQVDADAVINHADYISEELAYALSTAEDDAGFNGDGTSTYGGQTGLRTKLQDAAGNPTTSDAGGIIIADGNAWSEITLANLLEVVALLPEYADTPRTSWVCHRRFFYNVMLKLATASGGAEAREIMGDDGRPRPVFLGYPVTFSQQFPSAEANSQLAVTFGDHFLAAAFGVRRGVEVAFSDSAVVGGESTFERYQIAVRGLERFCVNVHDVGDTTTAGPVVGLQTLNS